MAAELRLHSWLQCSYANGPGQRAVLWLQGCTLACPGCFNPATHPSSGGELIPADVLAARILALCDRIEGITISGGEPLLQMDPLMTLLTRIRRESTLTALLLTGYDWEEVARMPGSSDLLRCLDVLICGPYDRSMHLAAGLRGSANKTVHFLSARYVLTDLEATPVGEVIIAPDGTVTTSGIQPPDLTGSVGVVGSHCHVPDPDKGE